MLHTCLSMSMNIMMHDYDTMGWYWPGLDRYTQNRI